MAAISLSSTALETTGSRLDGGIRSLVNAMRHRRAQRRIYRDTYSELSRMSERDLADIGISRLSIDEFARRAAYGEPAV